ncbi:MAG: NosD domain-containing protein, partial [Thermoplasmata archaeon]
IYNNTNYGITVTSNSNVIHHNNLIKNNGATRGASGNSQAYDSGTGNVWYDAATGQGNYWSNWDQQGSYPIDGGTASDNAPLPMEDMHPGIHINGDDQFTPENGVKSGLGTQSEPYIIEGWNIDAQGDSYGIWIENTTAYFVIKDCNVWNAADGTNAPYGAGIALNNVRNGRIENSVCSNSKVGIYLYGSSQTNVLTGNYVYNNEIGICLEESDSNTLTNNNASSNTNYGIYLYSSNSNTITYNWICDNTYYGVYLREGSSGNTINYNNFFRNNGASKGVIGNSQACDDVVGGNNNWDYNSWSNWNNEGTYPIAGEAGAEDRSPIPEFSNVPFFAVLFLCILGIVARKRNH